ncbi:CAP domain-containing protein [Nocardioides sp. cx-169]|uniref:CAP domain-containing protein n=1 Tax=Nocardioides sp. cx-169 TaxID=2899080 RepID=UPI001E54F94B|nr:CAP domain-containing protein [Nocardioides sp. cx-169]MCD4534568.1 CAP domain-containing protein [Nocardioides sp. cx-169]
MPRDHVLARPVLTLLLLLGVGLGPALVASPASAAPGPTTVTLRAAAAQVPVSKTVRLSGRVSGASARALVVLQRKAGERWVLVKRSRVRPNRTYAFAPRVRLGVNRFRVRVLRTPRLRPATSRVVLVRGARPAATAQVREVRAVVLRDTNEFRASQGKPALKAMAALDDVAQRWSARMARTGVFEHNPDYAGQYPSGWTRAGENIAYGYLLGEVVDAWIASPGHRENLLGDYTHLGIGVAWDAEGRPYYTQNFGKY